MYVHVHASLKLKARTCVLFFQILSSLERYLLPSLRDQPPDVEALRIYLSLPLCKAFESPENFATLQGPFAKAVISLQPLPQKVLGEKWCSEICSCSKFIHLFKTCTCTFNLPVPVFTLVGTVYMYMYMFFACVTVPVTFHAFSCQIKLVLFFADRWWEQTSPEYFLHLISVNEILRTTNFKCILLML